MSRITREEVSRVAELARLRLGEGEREALMRDLDAILDYAEQLNALATEDVPPTYHALPLATPFREDVVRASLAPDLALGNAPDRRETAFAVPKVLEGEDEG